MSPESAYTGAAADARESLAAALGAGEADRIARGIAQVLRYWRPDDGDAASLRVFLVDEFIPRGPALDATFERLEFVLERVDGYFQSMIREVSQGADLDVGPMLPIDARFSGWSPSAHLTDDLFTNRVAFVVLLNFASSTLAERLAHGVNWSRREWAERRLTAGFEHRVPAAVKQEIARVWDRADRYVNGYNIHMHRLRAHDGRRLFAPGLKLISHWGLRDELKACYSDPEGLEKQRLIRVVMERIVRQEIPRVVIDNPEPDWYPETNSVPDLHDHAEREPDTRYRHWIELFRALRTADRWEPDHPTHIARRFDQNREIPEPEVRALFESVLDSPLTARVGAMIRERLGRPLEPHDIWYTGFKPRARFTEAELDAITRVRYPTVDAFAADIPRILGALGFDPERARFLAARIAVDPSRGAGHAMKPRRRDDRAHLRTRVASGGMDYKGYNIAVHELGHNVEQVFSMAAIDHTLLAGVPNTAFSEAFAFYFQARDLELLGLAAPDDGDTGGITAGALRTLDTFWATREIAAVSLLDMEAWHWLYDHPDAEPAAFRDAVLDIACASWNRWFAPLSGTRDVPLLAIYSHLVDAAMYTPDYTLGRLISFQVDEHLRTIASPGEEIERLCRLGAITPEAWMRLAVGKPLSAEPLLAATERALAG